MVVNELRMFTDGDVFFCECRECLVVKHLKFGTTISIIDGEPSVTIDKKNHGQHGRDHHDFWGDPRRAPRFLVWTALRMLVTNQLLRGAIAI